MAPHQFASAHSVQMSKQVGGERGRTKHNVWDVTIALIRQITPLDCFSDRQIINVDTKIAHTCPIFHPCSVTSLTSDSPAYYSTTSTTSSLRPGDLRLRLLTGLRASRTHGSQFVSSNWKIQAGQFGGTGSTEAASLLTCVTFSASASKLFNASRK